MASLWRWSASWCISSLYLSCQWRDCLATVTLVPMLLVLRIASLVDLRDHETSLSCIATRLHPTNSKKRNVGYSAMSHYGIIYTSDGVLINICMKVDISLGRLEDSRSWWGSQFQFETEHFRFSNLCCDGIPVRVPLFYGFRIKASWCYNIIT